MLITLDLEGTLIDGELFPELGRKLGYGRDLEYITDAAISGDLPYAEAFEMRTAIITGESTKRIREVADTIPLVPGAKETIRILKGMDLIPVIVTGGFDIIAFRAARAAGLGIAFNATKKVREVANVSVEDRNIGAIIPFIKRHLEENA